MSKIIINQLYGIYDYEIDLSDKCIILIGENGLGKSTILKIIDCLVKGDYVELTRYPFASISLENEQMSVSVHFPDLFPSVDIFKRNYSIKYEAIRLTGVYNVDARDGIVQQIDPSIYGNMLEDVLNHFGAYQYCKLLSSIYFDISIDREILDFIHDKYASYIHYLECDYHWKSEIKHMMDELKKGNTSGVEVDAATLHGMFSDDGTYSWEDAELNAATSKKLRDKTKNPGVIDALLHLAQPTNDAIRKYIFQKVKKVLQKTRKIHHSFHHLFVNFKVGKYSMPDNSMSCKLPRRVSSFPPNHTW